MPVSRIFACEHCRHSFSENEKFYLHKDMLKEKSKGNAAALREALADFVEAYEEDSDIDIEIMSKAYEKAKSALSAPPRNYDRFNSVKDAAIAFARERQDAPYPCPDFTFSAWLFATATEQKGENK